MNDTAMRTELLKEILSVPTCTKHEDKLVAYLKDYCNKHGHDCEVDHTGNVLITKGVPAIGGYYPLVAAHTDSVHDIQHINIIREDNRMFAVSDDGEYIGCGGDDKAGVFICLELLETLPVLKVAFFWGEETGCHGSWSVDDDFFSDVGYCLEFDSPESDIISFSSNGYDLFDVYGDFANKAVPILDSYSINKWQRHPYTDVSVLKRRFDFTCLNLPAGYYNMHSPDEYVNVLDVENSMLAGIAIVKALGHAKYKFVSNIYETQTVPREVTGLRLRSFCSVDIEEDVLQ